MKIYKIAGEQIDMPMDFATLIRMITGKGDAYIPLETVKSVFKKEFPEWYEENKLDDYGMITFRQLAYQFKKEWNMFSDDGFGRQPKITTRELSPDEYVNPSTLSAVLEGNMSMLTSLLKRNGVLRDKDEIIDFEYKNGGSIEDGEYPFLLVEGPEIKNNIIEI